MALVSWFPLNGDIRDRINGNVFSNASSATFVETDMFGKSLGGSNVQFAFPASVTNEIFNSDCCSIAFWIYVTGTSGSDIIFGNTDMSASSTNRKYSLFQYSTCNDLYLSWQNDDATMYTSFVISGALPSQKWTHVCLAYDGTKGIYCYINGELKWSTTRTASQEAATWNVAMNAFKQSPLRYLNDFRIYNHCLSVKEVKELAKGLFLKYSFEGLTEDGFMVADGQTIYDESGFGNNAYLKNGNDIEINPGFGKKWNDEETWSEESNYPGISFSGSNKDYIVCKDFPAKQTFTFSCWIDQILPDNGSSYSFIMGNGRDYGTGCGASLGFYKSGKPFFVVGNGTNSVWVSPSSGYRLTNGNKYMLTATYDGVTAKLFENGILIASSALAGPLTWSDVDVGHPFVLGKMAHSYTSTSSYFPYSGDLFDVRVYNTALPADDILDMYKTCKSITRQGELMSKYMEETCNKKLSITRQSTQTATRFTEIVTLEDGSMWLQLMHHDLKGTQNANVRFTSGANVRNSNVYLDENRWSCFPLIKTCDHGTNFELMVVEQEGEESSAFVRHRWIQTVNPYEATYATTTHANITAIENISSSYGGMYPGAENNAWFFNNSVNGNWFGCGLISDGWANGYVPSYNGSTVKYIQNVYIRVYSVNYSERKGGIISAKELKCI